MFVNKTPHKLTIFRGDGSTLELDPIAPCPRASEVIQRVATLDGIEISRVTYGNVLDLPDPEDGTIYVVSMLVRSACPNRTDLVSPGKLVRDSGGNVIGAEGFYTN